MDLGKLVVSGARGATLCKSQFASSVVALKEVGGMGIEVQGLLLGAVLEATNHRDELCCIFEGVDGDEQCVVTHANMSDGMGSNRGWPFKVPPELGNGTLSTRSSNARVATCQAKRTHGMRYALGQDLGVCQQDSAHSMRQRSRCRSQLIWWRKEQLWIKQAVLPMWKDCSALPSGGCGALWIILRASQKCLLVWSRCALFIHRAMAREA